MTEKRDPFLQTRSECPVCRKEFRDGDWVIEIKCARRKWPPALLGQIPGDWVGSASPDSVYRNVHFGCLQPWFIVPDKDGA